MGNCLGGDDASPEEAPPGGKKPKIANQNSSGGTSHPGSLHENLIRHRSKGDVFDKYEKIHVLGQGSMGYVAKVRLRDDKVGGSALASNRTKKGLLKSKTTESIEDRRSEPITYALKSILVDRVSPLFLQELRNEIDILKTMDHPHIAKAHEVYDNKKQIYIVLELCDGGDLYTKAPYTEKQCAAIMGQLLSAVKYMHDHGIVHRDLKFENIMLEDDKSDPPVIKVIDFGLSRKFLAGEADVMTEGVGTIYTMAPQVLQGVYTSKADLWSCGVIAYMVLTSHRPFYHRKRRLMIDQIMRAKYSMAGEHWDGKSEASKDFVNKLIVLDPKQRYSAGQALKHEWLSKEFNLSDRKPRPSVISAVDNNLIRYKDSSKLKKIALNVIAHRSNAKEIMSLRQCFDQYDSANDGVITFEEFEMALKESNLEPALLKEIFDSIDINRNGIINYTEFLAATMGAHGRIEEERLAEAFDRLDADDSGYISKKNLMEILGHDASVREIEKILEDADKDGDGQISYAEFVEMFRKTTTDLAHTVAHMESTGTTASSSNLMGVDAKIPGGKYDSNLSSVSKS